MKELIVSNKDESLLLYKKLENFRKVFILSRKVDKYVKYFSLFDIKFISNNNLDININDVYNNSNILIIDNYYRDIAKYFKIPNIICLTSSYSKLSKFKNVFDTIYIMKQSVYNQNLILKDFPKISKSRLKKGIVIKIC